MNRQIIFGMDLVASISGSRESWEYGTVNMQYPNKHACNVRVKKHSHIAKDNKTVDALPRVPPSSREIQLRLDRVTVSPLEV
jgi:hypothetical protein